MQPCITLCLSVGLESVCVRAYKCVSAFVSTLVCGYRVCLFVHERACKRLCTSETGVDVNEASFHPEKPNSERARCMPSQASNSFLMNETSLCPKTHYDPHVSLLWVVFKMHYVALQHTAENWSYIKELN